MNIYTFDIIIAILLIIIGNNPVLNLLQNIFGINFLMSEIIIGLIVIIIVILIHKFILKRIMK